MNWHQFLCLLSLIPSLLESRALTDEENEKRQEECGKNGDKWLVTIRSETNPPINCTGALISTRHVLASTHCIGKPVNGGWDQNYLNYFFHKTKCDEQNIIIHEVLASKIEVRKPDEKLIGRGRYLFLFGFCRIAREGFLYEFPDDLMIIEFAEDTSYTKNLQPICLSREMSDADPDTDINFNGFEFETNGKLGKLLTHQTKVVNENKKGTSKRVDERLFLTENGFTQCPKSNGGLAVREIDGRLTVVGTQIQHTCETTEPGYEVYQSIAYFSNEICDYTGICSYQLQNSGNSTFLHVFLIIFVFFRLL